MENYTESDQAMTTKTHQILCRHTGEYSHTAKDPVEVWTGQVDLTEKQDCILNSDDWRGVAVNRWAVVEVELPEWLDPASWIRNSVQWKYLWGMDADRSWPESWQRALLQMGGHERYACIGLLKTKSFRSEFRASLRRQLTAWIESSPDDRHRTPFSPRQWDALLTTYNRRAAEQIETSLYRNR